MICGGVVANRRTLAATMIGTVGQASRASRRSSAMANQAEPRTMGGAAPESAPTDVAMHASSPAPTVAYGQGGGGTPTVAGHAGPYPAFHGRTVSWVAVSMVMVGFVVGGFAMMFGTGGPIWWMFWTGAGLAALGLLIALATNIFEDWY